MVNRSNVIKLQCPFERIKKYSTNPEVNLYRAVIMQMVIDSTNTSKDPTMLKDQKHALDFLFGETEDFAIMCDDAELSIDEVRSLAQDLIKSHKAKSKN
jgi:hypothetical protein